MRRYGTPAKTELLTAVNGALESINTGSYSIGISPSNVLPSRVDLTKRCNSAASAAATQMQSVVVKLELLKIVLENLYTRTDAVAISVARKAASIETRLARINSAVSNLADIMAGGGPLAKGYSIPTVDLINIACTPVDIDLFTEWRDRMVNENGTLNTDDLDEYLQYLETIGITDVTEDDVRAYFIIVRELERLDYTAEEIAAMTPIIYSISYLDQAYVVGRFDGNAQQQVINNIVNTVITRYEGDNFDGSAPANGYSSNGIALLTIWEIGPSSPYCQYDSSGNITAIRNAQLDDGGYTVGVGNFIAYGDQDTIDYYINTYGVDPTDTTQYVPIDVVYQIFYDRLTEYTGYVDTMVNNLGLNLSQQQYDAIMLLAYNKPVLVFEGGAIYNLLSEGNNNRDDWRTAILNYYQSLSDWDKFHESWTNRTEDFLECYFDGEYVYYDNE